MFVCVLQGAISEAVDKYCVGVPPVHWLPWYVMYYSLFYMHFYCYVNSSLFKSCICRRRIPQLLTCLVRREGQKILNLLCNIGRVHPQVTASAIAEKFVAFVSILFNYIFAKYFDLRRGYTRQRFVHLVSQRFKLCVAALRDQGPPQRTRENQLNVLIG